MTAVRKLRPEILLHPNIPKALHGLAPRVIRGREWWDKVRRAAYASTDHHCCVCGVSRFRAKYYLGMEAHELYSYSVELRRGRFFGLLTYGEAVPLCHRCHNYIHSGRLQAILDKGEITESKYNDIIRHGLRILRQAKLLDLKGPLESDSQMLETLVVWDNWRLVFEGEEYKSKWRDIVEYEEYYSNLKSEGV